MELAGDIGERPGTPGALHDWIKSRLGLCIPRRAFVTGHAAPFAYLVHAFFEGRGSFNGGDEAAPGPADCVVWANRGGGKTFLGAVATLLDLVFKRGIEIRILGGSFEQSGRMSAYLRSLLEAPALRDEVGRVTEKRVEMKNGSRVELLAQSETSVRGTHVQKLRCDEVELFDRDVWEAAQLTTRSAVLDGIRVRGSIECLSTMHRAHGVMRRLVDDARRGARHLLRWSVLDVLEQCGPACAPERGGCKLGALCDGRGMTRKEPGHVMLEDALTMRSRVAEATWEAEMLCESPLRDDAALPEFDPSVHVFSSHVPADALYGVNRPGGALWVCGMDFGFRAPTVILWGMVDGAGVLRIMDERVERGVIVEEHARAILEAPWPRPAWVGVDPAGRARNGQTGESDVQVLRKSGLSVRTRRHYVQRGLAMVRARLRPADGSGARLFVHERCRKLIESMERHHYDAELPDAENPVKDGTDHAVDALRYLVVNLDGVDRAVRTLY